MTKSEFFFSLDHIMYLTKVTLTYVDYALVLPWLYAKFTFGKEPIKQAQQWMHSVALKVFKTLLICCYLVTYIAKKKKEKRILFNQYSLPQIPTVLYLHIQWMTYDCANYSSNLVIKFAEDATVVGRPKEQQWWVSIQRSFQNGVKITIFLSMLMKLNRSLMMSEGF